MSLEPAALPASATPGAELAALAPYYRDWVWTGTIEAGGMGPGSPAMTGTGRARCRLAASGLWYECDFEQDQRLLDGTFVLTWRLHWVAGWDGRAHEYRATSVDNQGPNLGLYRGRIEDGRLVYESADAGLPRIRLSWIPDGEDACRWRNEYTLDGTTWILIEEYAMTAPDPAG